MPSSTPAALIVTTIQAPNDVLRELSDATQARHIPFIIIGDRKSPADFELAGAEYFNVDEQHLRFGDFSHRLPVNHYSRKNLGYLAALDTGCQWLIETDDDNFPLANFLDLPPASLATQRIDSENAWVNAYRFFLPEGEFVWPRGFPLESLGGDGNVPESRTGVDEECAIIQGLADDNPDVDAVFRLTRKLPINFIADAPPISLAAGNWCPFNSQNTWTKRRYAALAYLPSHCSFRMTDIWRSLIAQRCLWAQQRHVIFTAPSVRQERNEHNLLRDFEDEVSGYLGNAAIASTLQALPLSGNLFEDFRACYAALIATDFFPAVELELVDAWLEELNQRNLS